MRPTIGLSSCSVAPVKSVATGEATSISSSSMLDVERANSVRLVELRENGQVVPVR